MSVITHCTAVPQAAQLNGHRDYIQQFKNQGFIQVFCSAEYDGSRHRPHFPEGLDPLVKQIEEKARTTKNAELVKKRGDTIARNNELFKAIWREIPDTKDAPEKGKGSL